MKINEVIKAANEDQIASGYKKFDSSPETLVTKKQHKIPKADISSGWKAQDRQPDVPSLWQTTKAKAKAAWGKASAATAGKANEAEGDLTSGEDIVLSKNGEQAVRDLKLSDQEVELLKAVALGLADMSDLGDLEQDIFEYWFGNNPEDFNPDLHGGGADPSDTIMDELESWFEDKHPDEARFDAEFKASSDRIARDAIDDEKTLTPFKYSKGEKITDWTDPENIKAAKKAPDYKGSTSDHGFGRKKIKDDVDVKLARMRKLAGVGESHALNINLGPTHPHASTAAKGPGKRGPGYNDKYQWSGDTDLSNLDPDTQAIDAMDYSDSYDAGKAGNVGVKITPAGSKAFDKAMRKRGKWVDPAIDDRNKG